MKKIFILLSAASCMNCLSQIPAYVPANNLVGYWPFTGNANDISGNSHNGSVNGAMLTTDRFNSPNAAYSFNGSSDHIVVPDHPSLSGFNDVSLSLWLRIGGFNGIQGIVAKWYQAHCNPNSPSDTYCAEIDNNIIQFATNNNNLTAFTSPPPAMTAADLNVWKHIVYIHSASQGASIYINGVLAATDPATGSICNSTNPLYFGADYDGNWVMLHRFFHGKLDDIGIWSRVVTLCEIKALYHSSAPTLNISSTSSVLCAGSGATLTANGVSTYTWTNGGNIPAITVSPTITSTYVVAGTNTLTGCTYTVNFTQQVKNCTGITGQDAENKLAIYPNPVNDELTVDFYSEVKGNFTLSMEDLSGKNILNQGLVIYKDAHSSAKIALGHLQNGIYMLKIRDTHGNLIKTEKITVSH